VYLKGFIQSLWQMDQHEMYISGDKISIELMM